jgi:hypothetical protein
MKRDYWAFFVLVLFISLGKAQDFTITGKVLDMDQNPIPLANVLLKDQDSVLVSGTATDEEGLFRFANLPAGRYLISASYILNPSQVIALELTSDQDVGILTITEEAQALEGVTVTYEKPRLERFPDRLVFNVANTAIVDGTIWELLKATPSLTMAKGQLSVKGNTAITVLINDRRVNLPAKDLENLLSGASAGSVEAIEVITNPPAKYSAEDGVLINIKMGKNLVAGYNGAVFNRYRQAVFAKHTVGTDHYFKGKKTDFSVNYSFSKDKWLTRYTDITNFPENGALGGLWTADQDRIFRSDRHNLSTFFDYSPNERNTFSFSSINVLTPKIGVTDDSRTVINGADGGLRSTFETTNTSGRDQLNLSFYGDWTHRFKKEGAELSLLSHYTFYDKSDAQALNTDFFDGAGSLTGENDFTTASQQKINLYTLQLDYSTPLGTASRLETGLRYAGIASKSTILQQGFDRDQPGINPTEAGVFDYDEAIYAAYLSFNTQWDKWKLRSGLRAEQTETVGNLDIANGPNENSYLELFPSFSLQHLFNDQNNLTLQYARRIDRPRYDYINPFQYFQNNFTVFEGNPNLLPAIRNRLTLVYAFNKNYTVELFYEDDASKFNEQVFQDNDANLLRFISDNLDGSFNYGIDGTYSLDLTERWYSYLLVAYFYRRDTFRDLESQVLVENAVNTFIARANQSFTLLKDKSLLADLSFFYQSPMVNGNRRMDGISMLDFNLRKTFWNKAASLSLGIEDIFNQGNFFSRRQFLDQNNTTFTRKENRLLTVGFRYKFGNTKIRDNYKRKNLDERQRI